MTKAEMKAAALQSMGKVQLTLPLGLHKGRISGLEDVYSKDNDFLGWNILITINDKEYRYYQGIKAMAFTTQKIESCLTSGIEDHEELIHAAISSGMLFNLIITPYVSDEGKRYSNVDFMPETQLTTSSTSTAAQKKPRPGSGK